MTTSSRRFLLLPAALAGLALAACSSPYGSSSAVPPPATTTTIAGAGTPAQTKAADLRARLTYLLVEHAYLLAATVEGPTSLAPNSLTANGADLANALGESFGAPFTAQFAPLWAARNLDIEAYGKAKAAKDDVAAAAATKQLATDVASLADAFHATNRFLPVHTVSNPPTGIGDELTTDDTTYLTWVDAAAAADPTSYTKLVAAAEAMPHTADVLAAAAAKLDPTTYPGTATGAAANLRSSLTTMLVEHLELASLTMATIASGQAAGPAAVALDANSLQLHNAFASAYDDATAGRFTQLWQSQIDAYTAYAKAAAAKDQQAATTGLTQLNTFAEAFASFLGQVTNGKLDPATMSKHVRLQIVAVEQVIRGAALNSPDIFLQVRAAVARGPILASELAEAIAEQNPTRFLP